MDDATTTRLSITVSEEVANDSMSQTVVYAGVLHRSVVAAIFCVVAFVGLIGNSVVIAAVAASRRLQTPTNVFVVSLAFSDLYVCMTLPFQATAQLSGDDGWPLPNAICRAVGGSAIMSMTCSVLSLAMISLNRLVLITRSKRTYEKLFSAKYNVVFAAATWLLTLLVFVLPPLCLGRLGFLAKYKLCAWDTQAPEAIIFELGAGLTFFAASIVITGCYIKIYTYIRRHKNVMKRNKVGNSHSIASVHVNRVAPLPISQRVIQSMALPGVHNVPEASFLNEARVVNARAPAAAKSRRNDVDITLNLLYVICIFYICVLPYGVVLALSDILQVPLLTFYSGALFVSSSAINPFIYARKHAHFRDVMTCLIKFRWAAIPDPSAWLRNRLS